ncbi:hypothetical protein DPMN_108905 [Dreissena polymorpha]|uniref:Uncharacterized protein n=1 Tax=Dreissena polymorpha TaxID=45954 RepID=A0A9D4K9B3_DREPO|nr:hypothetical protein DPMN_108905 [Dreissena polymorpha]
MRNDVGEVQTVKESRIVNSGELLAVGCRVKPGPDFDYKIYAIDPFSCDVVLRMYEPLSLVIWDNGERDMFRYGMDGTKEIELA